MSNPDLPDSPAYPGAFPTRSAPTPVDPALAWHLSQALGESGKSDKLVGGPGWRGGYRWQRANGSFLFLKILEERRAQHIERMTTILASLPGVAPTPRLIGHVVVPGHLVLVHEYVQGRMPRAVSRDLEHIGAAVAHLHQLLKRHPQQASVRAQARAWLHHLDHSAAAALSRPPAGLSRVALDWLAIGPRLSDMVPPGDHQMLHGDLNRGNFLIRDGQPPVSILDFEDAPRSHGPVESDVVFALERLCFAGDGSAEKPGELIAAFLRGYRGRGRLAPLLRQNVEALLIFHGRRALAVLAAQCLAGRPVAEGEVGKFEGLLGDAARKARIMAECA